MTLVPGAGDGPGTGFLLVLNAGSSSLKFGVYRKDPRGAWSLDARDGIEGIDLREGRTALEHLEAWLRSRYAEARFVGIGHRVVHGGERFPGPAIVTPEVLDSLRALTPIAPLHQPHNLAMIEAMRDRRPGIPQVACFDTSFHRGQPEVARLVPLPLEIRRGGVQRYGFHGLSCEYIAAALLETAPEIASGRVIVAHLGSGSSLCALRAGKSVDGTFGFTALDGLCMGTRPGALDPGVVLYLFQSLGLSAEEAEEILYRKSGLLGISGKSSDMRDLLESDEPGAKLAVDYFVYRAARELGGLVAALRGIDGLVFTAGIGENSPEIRRRICEASAWLGITLDGRANGANGARISTLNSPVPAWVIATNEEAMIAGHTARLLEV